MQMRYDTGEFDFRSDIEKILGPDLEGIHRVLGDIPLRVRETDQYTEAHRQFYDHFDDKVATTYRNFIRRVVEPLVGGPVVYQRVPTFRVHLLGNRAVGEYHRDRDYNHNPEAITFWLPVTDAYGNNSVHIVMDGKKRPMHVPYGHVLIFDSVNMVHGNEINTTLNSRVSMDFRVVPEDRFVPSEEESLNTHVRMNIGGYYERQED